VQRLDGQLRIVGGLSGGAVIGWDMGSALALGAALGIEPLVIGVFLPPIEAVMVQRMQARMEQDHG
jgi:hypothetical protein